MYKISNGGVKTFFMRFMIEEYLTQYNNGNKNINIYTPEIKIKCL